MVEGVTKGFEKRLELQGVGYRATLRGTDLELNVGFSHPVVVKPPQGISFEVRKRRQCWSKASTSSRSPKSPLRCARCARRSPTRAREFAMRASTYAGKLANEPNGSPDEAPSPRAAPPARPRQAPRHGRAAAPRRLPLEQGDRGAARRRRRRQDAGGRELAATAA